MGEIERLRSNLLRALSVLAPKFRVTDEELRTFGAPLLEIGDRTQYVSEPKKFVFRPEHIDNEEVLGEEVSHFLHMSINPQIKALKTHLDLLPLVYVRECVGHYGAIIYLHAVDSSYKSHKWPFAPDLQGIEFFDHVGHEFGYKRAVRLFEIHGERLLPGLARMPYEYASRFLSSVAPQSFYERNVLPVFEQFGLRI